jgi:hypothetical protein
LWRDRLVHRSIVTEQQVLTPRQLAAQVKRLIATPAEWVARVRLDAEGLWYERIQLTAGYEVRLISPEERTAALAPGASRAMV